MSANVTVTSTGFVGWTEQVIDQQSLAGDLFRFGTGVPDRRTAARRSWLRPNTVEGCTVLGVEVDHSPLGEEQAHPPPSNGHTPRSSALQPERPALPASLETFYGLNEQPFTLSIDPRYLYHSVAHDHAAQDLLRAVGRHDGLVVLTGDIGNGKTTLCRAVVEELDRRTLTSLVLEPIASLDEMLHTVLVDFGVISREDIAQGRLTRTSRAELIEKLREFLASLVQLGAFAVVIIDDAQNLPVPVLRDLGALLDLNGQRPLLQIALVGEPALMKRLAHPELRALAQRIALRAELDPLVGDEIGQYVMHRLAIAGTHPRVEFDAMAFARLRTLTGGVPRLVNLVCDRALTLGYSASATVIDEPLILSAARVLDAAAPQPQGQRLVRVALSGILLGALMGVGAAAAAWMFRAPLAGAVLRWEAVPAPPQTPLRPFPAPAVPPPAPATPGAPSSSPRL
jgi:general secretion pathway protein A